MLCALYIARFRDVIVFVLGGATYEESRDMKQLAKQFDCRIVLGGSTIHNTSTFLADIAQLGNQPTPPPTQIDFGLSNLTCLAPFCLSPVHWLRLAGVAFDGSRTGRQRPHHYTIAVLHSRVQLRGICGGESA
eukprot:Lankesteria_metandrocarpae@DN4967_c0_g1_i1.p1